jgi:hypothetical protein
MGCNGIKSFLFEPLVKGHTMINWLNPTLSKDSPLFSQLVPVGNDIDTLEALKVIAPECKEIPT